MSRRLRLVEGERDEAERVPDALIRRVRGAMIEVEGVSKSGFLPIFPLVFASSVFVLIQSMPGWLQAFAQNQPISRAAGTVRALTEGGPVATNLIWTLLWSAAILAVFIPLAVRRYRKV